LSEAGKLVDEFLAKTADDHTSNTGKKK
jgi:hypothetical protein